MDLRNYDGTAMATVRGHQLPVAKPKMHPGKKQGQRWTQLDERDVGPGDFITDLRGISKRTASDCRNYGALVAQHRERERLPYYNVRQSPSLQRRMAGWSSRERRKNKHSKRLYPNRETVVGHVPDAALTQKPWGGGHWLPMTSHANTLVGRVSRKSPRRLKRFVFLENDGKHYHYW